MTTKPAIFDAGPPPPCPAPFNMAQYVLAAGGDVPDKTALEILSETSVERWSHAQLRGAVLGLATGLLGHGLRAGDRVMLRIGNAPEFPIVFLAAIAAGIVPVPTPAQLTAREVSALIDDLDPAAIVAGPGVQVPTDTPVDVITNDTLRGLMENPPHVITPGDPNALAYIVYTSGTSGHPRAVMHAHRAIWARRMMWQGWYDLVAGDRLLHAGAFNWTYTLGTGLCDPWAIGATALIPADGVSRSALARLIRTSNATIFAAAPGVYRQLLKLDADFAFPALRHALSAGEKLPPRLAKEWQRRSGRRIYEALGMSEVSTFISSNPANPVRDTQTGRPQPGRRVAVLSECDHKIAACNTAGILAVSRHDPGLMLGYRGAPAETERRFSGAWFLTGDMVEMDETGALTYLGRADDMMNAGGYRVSPLEVESVLNSHPHIVESAAVALEVKPDTFVIAACYLSDIELSEQALATFATARLARYKCPRIFRRVDTLPKGANNKLLRGVLRARMKGMT